MARPSVKVSREDLIAAVEKAIAKKKADFEKEQATYPAKLGKWHGAVKKALATASPMKLETTSVFRKRHIQGVIVPVKGDMPRKPTLNDNREQRDLKMLKMSSQETFTISDISHWARYLGF